MNGAIFPKEYCPVLSRARRQDAGQALTGKRRGDYIELTPMQRSLNWSWDVGLAVVLVCILNCPGAALQASPGLPDLSDLSSAERQMIQSACRLDRQTGAAAYQCARQQLDALEASPGRPDLRAIPRADREMIESACGADRQIGPAAYYRCQRQQLDALRASPGGPDLTTIPGAERQRIESACKLDRQMCGPAIYYRCLSRRVDAFSTNRSTQRVAGPSQQIRGGALSVGSGAIPPAGRPPGADSGSAKGKSQADLSSSGRLGAWIGGLVAVGLCAGILYSLVKPRRCGRCGKPARARGGSCADCAATMQKSAEVASQQRDAEERARAEAERCAREQWEIEESRRLSVLAELHRLTTSEFQDLIASLFIRDGYTVRPGGGRDERTDFVLEMGQEKDLAQCKISQGDLESAAVGEFYEVVMYAGARHGFLVTTASFTESALGFAEGRPISLISAAEVLQWMEGAYSSQDRKVILPTVNHDHSFFDPYAVLGVSRDASLKEIRAAYLREMFNYHPDKVAHLGKDLQELANTKAQEINRAYAELAESQ
jgi:DnaJ-domain-containing protein 1